MVGNITGLAFALIACAALVAGCGGDDNGVQDEDQLRQEVEATVREAVSAFNAQDMQRFLTYWTDDGLESEFQMSRDDLAALSDVFFSESPEAGIQLRGVRADEIRSNRATAEVEYVFGQVIAPQRYVLIRQDNQWRINDTQPVSAQVPDGVREVDLTLDEFSFSFDAAQIDSGNVAFSIENAGDQPHEALLLTVPPGYSVEQLLAEALQGIPEGVTVVGGVGPFAPGGSGALVLTNPLASGSYMFVCFMPDQDAQEEVPHAARGMGSVFQVP